MKRKKEKKEKRKKKGEKGEKGENWEKGERGEERKGTYCRDFHETQKSSLQNRMEAHSKHRLLDSSCESTRERHGIRQTKLHPITKSIVPLDFFERVITQHGEMTVYQRSTTPRHAPRVILENGWHKQQHHQQQQDVLIQRSRGKLLAGHCPRLQA